MSTVIDSLLDPAWDERELGRAYGPSLEGPSAYLREDCSGRGVLGPQAGYASPPAAYVLHTDGLVEYDSERCGDPYRLAATLAERAVYVKKLQSLNPGKQALRPPTSPNTP